MAINKTAAKVLGCISMLADLGRSCSGLICGDSSAAIAIANRRGCGKLHHINVELLWIQDNLLQKLELKKVLGENFQLTW